MKLLYVGDIHERMTPPRNRIDDWQSTLDAKAKEILAIANRNKVKAILQGGDFNDTAKIQDEYQAKIIKRWSTVNVYDIVKKLVTGEVTNEKVLKELKNGKPMISVAGNHDQFGSSMQGFSRTSLSFLEQVGLLNLVTKENPIILKDESGFTVAITGSNYSLSMDKDKTHKAYIVDEKLGDFHIHIVHGMLTNQSFGNLFSYTLVDDIKETKADLTISGHDHIGFDPVEIDGKWFVNPGSIIRLNNGEREMNRVPKVMMIEISKEKGIQLKMKPLKSAKPAEEVLSVEKKEVKKEMDNRIQKIKDSLEMVSIEKTKDILDIVEELPLSETFTENEKAEVKDKIIEKMKKDVTKPLSDPTPYIFTKMELENFQCHEKTTLEFDKRLNVIVGESDKGKSSIIRAFEFVFGEAASAAKEYIRYGADYASVKLYMDNGIIVERRVEKKSNGFNGYNIYSPIDGKWVKSNTKNTPAIQELLGYSQMVIDEKTHFSINFLNQDDNHFFIGRNTTPTMKAKIIGTVYKTHYADSVLRDLENDFKKSNAQLIAKREDVKRYQDEVDCMVHVEPLGEVVEKAKQLLQQIEEKQQKLQVMKERKASLDRLQHKITKYESYCKASSKLLSQKQQMDNAHLLHQSIQLKRDKFAKLVHDRKSGVLMSAYMKRLKPFLEKGSDIEKTITQYRRYQLLQEKKHHVDALLNKGKVVAVFNAKAKQLLQQKETIDALIESTKALNKKTKKLEELKVLAQRGATLKKNCANLKPLVVNGQSQYDALVHQVEQYREKEKRYTSLLSLQQKIEESEGIYNENTKELQQVQEDYKSYLEEIQVCPVCMHQLDANTIDSMVGEEK